MGFKDYLKGQLLDVIEWEDQSQDTIAHKVDMRHNEIQNGAWLTVRPGQAAVFVNEGQIADIFTEGRHKLVTQNLPILSSLKHWAYGFNSSFKSDVYFVNIKQFMGQKWGTATPIPVSDPKFEQVEIRAFGTFAFKVKDAAVFMREVVSTDKNFKVKEIQEQLRSFIQSHFATIVGALNITVVDYSKNYNMISEAMKKELSEEFQQIGLDITAFTISSITLPEEVNQFLRMRTQVNMAGGMNNYAQMKTLDVMGESVKNPGMNGMNQMGMGLGMGLGMGNMFAQNMQNALQNQTSFQPAPAGHNGSVPPSAHVNPPIPPAQGKDILLCSCGAALPKNAKFCMECGSKASLPESAKNKFCPECGTKWDSKAKFCMECGTKLS